MRNRFGRSLAVGLTAALAAAVAPPAQAEITDIAGSASATVVEFVGGAEVQRDFAQNIVPLTTPEPPATATAKLDRLSPTNELTAAGSVIAVFDNPNLAGLTNPNDVGLDLGAFSDNETSSWFVEGTVNETRTIVFSPAEAGTGHNLGDSAVAQSRIVLSGVLIITAEDMAKDLTGTEIRFNLSLSKRQQDELAQSLLEGELVFSGGPDGVADISSATGVFAGAFLPILNFLGELDGLPNVQAIPIAGMQLPYEYPYIVGQPFDLDLTVSSQLRTTPNGVGVAAVFGLPQDGLASILSRVKKDDRGRQLADRIAQHVDTTGAAYVGAPAAPWLFPFCGALGAETIGALIAGAAMMTTATRRRRRRAERPFLGMRFQ
jgi:hypothetical protein